MILDLIINAFFDLAIFVVNLLDFSGIASIPTGIISGLNALFTGITYFIPFNELRPVFFFYGGWFAVRSGLAIFGAIKKYVPLL